MAVKPKGKATPPANLRSPVVKSNTQDNMDDFIKNIAGAVNKQIGEGSAMIMDGSDGAELLDVPFWVKTWIPQLDFAIGGPNHPGVPGGRIIECYGAESHGKTTVAMWILKCMIDQLKGVGVYQDSEHAFSNERAKQLGLDMTKIIFSQPDIMEEVFEAQEIIITHMAETNSKRPVGIIWDSIAATSTKSEVEGDYGDAIMGIHARIMSQSLRKIKGLLKRNNVMTLYINQIRDKMNVSWGEKTDTFGKQQS